MGPNSSSIMVHLRCQYLQEACLDSSSCSPQIHQHPKAGVTSLPQQLHCITYYLLLYHIHSELAHVLFFALGLFLLLFPLSGRLFFKTVTHLTPLLHSGLCSVVTSSWRPSQIDLLAATIVFDNKGSFVALVLRSKMSTVNLAGPVSSSSALVG